MAQKEALGHGLTDADGLMDYHAIGDLGLPALKLRELQIWVHGRQFPNEHDYWDGNWLRVTAYCGARGASVVSAGPIIHLSELEHWCSQLENLSTTLSGEANLTCIEPAIGVSLKSRSLGHMTMEVSITPEHLDQRHWFQFDLDQSYLGPLIKQLRTILSDYPLRGSRDQPPKQIFTK